MVTSTITPAEEAQLNQTIEMFEVITQSQSNDCQSLEILKEAYSKLGREQDVLKVSKQIAVAYVELGQLSSAILEYETILQRHPEDEQVQAALREIEAQAAQCGNGSGPESETAVRRSDTTHTARTQPKPRVEIEDGRRQMEKLFVESKLVAARDFEQNWPEVDPAVAPKGVIEPFIQVLADKGLVPIEKSLRLLCDKTRITYLPLGLYDMDMDLARTFPQAICQRWCVLPIDRMSKSILVATANPYNQQAARELAAAAGIRMVWYLVQPTDLVKNLKKAFR